MANRSNSRSLRAPTGSGCSTTSWEVALLAPPAALSARRVPRGLALVAGSNSTGGAASTSALTQRFSRHSPAVWLPRRRMAHWCLRPHSSSVRARSRLPQRTQQCSIPERWRDLLGPKDTGHLLVQTTPTAAGKPRLCSGASATSPGASGCRPSPSAQSTGPCRPAPLRHRLPSPTPAARPPRPPEE